MTIIGGVAVMLVWAGIVEAFFSQYHAPVLPYGVKIAFGAVELVALTWFLARAAGFGTAAGRLSPVVEGSSVAVKAATALERVSVLFWL